jgi:poly(3-hydroxybutyrate) depolymerase
MAGLCLLGGCIVHQRQDVPEGTEYLREPDTDNPYFLYVPSTYDPAEDWPLVITLHGTIPYDTYDKQINEWKYLAEQKGFIVAAPFMRSSQGVLPVIPGWWHDDLDKDRKAILGTLRDVTRRYNIDEDTVLLTGFSGGGFPMYEAGLKHPEKFGMLVARACNFKASQMERIELTDRARKLPFAMYWGKDDGVRKQCWEAYRYLRRRGFDIERELIKGGHFRHPQIAYRFWKEILPARHRQRAR